MVHPFKDTSYFRGRLLIVYVAITCKMKAFGPMQCLRNNCINE